MKAFIILLVLTLSLIEELRSHHSKHKLHNNNYQTNHKDAKNRHPRIWHVRNTALLNDYNINSHVKTTREVIKNILSDSYSGEEGENDKAFDYTIKSDHFIHIPPTLSESTTADVLIVEINEETTSQKNVDVSDGDIFKVSSNHSENSFIPTSSTTSASLPSKRKKGHRALTTSGKISILHKSTAAPVFPGMNTFRRGKPVLYPSLPRVNESTNDSRQPSNIKSTALKIATAKQNPSTSLLESTSVITPLSYNDSSGDNYKHLTTSILLHRVFDDLIVSNRSYKELIHGEPEDDGESNAHVDLFHVFKNQEINPPFPYPVPQWNDAFSLWKEAWYIHIYLVGGLFSLLGFFSLFNFFHVKCVKHLLSKGYLLMLNFMILVLAASRVISMFWDPYNSERLFPPIGYLLFNVGYPALTAAFSILFLALLKITRVQILFCKLQNPCALAVVIIVHFTLYIVADLIVYFIPEIRVIILAPQVVFLVWGLLLFLSYIYIFQTLYKAGLQCQKEIMKEDITKLYPLEGNPVFEPPKPTLCLALKITLIISLIGILIVVLQMYGMIQVINIFSYKKPEAWLWWRYELSFRLGELAISFLMCYVSSQPFKYEMNMQSWQDCCLCRCCSCFDRDRRNPWSVGYMRQTTRSRSCDSDILQNHNGLKSPDTDQTDYSLPMQEIANQKGMANSYVGKASTTSSYGSSKSSRPQSMLYMENGFVRFRGDNDPEQEPIDFSPDEENPITSDLDNITITSYHSLPDNEEISPSNENLDSGNCSPILNKRKHLESDEETASEFEFRMPSSINLNASIEQAMNELVSRTFAKVPSDLSIQSEYQNHSAVSLHSLCQNKLSPYNTLNNIKQARSFNELNKNEIDNKNRKSKQFLPQLCNSNISLNPGSNGYHLLDNDDIMNDPDSPQKLVNTNDCVKNYLTVNANYSEYETEHFKNA